MGTIHDAMATNCGDQVMNKIRSADPDFQQVFSTVVKTVPKMKMIMKIIKVLEVLFLLGIKKILEMKIKKKRERKRKKILKIKEKEKKKLN